MSLWNWLVPSLFHGPAVRYWQAVGLLLLSRILFGGVRGRGGWRGHWRQRMWRARRADKNPGGGGRVWGGVRPPLGSRPDPGPGPTAPPASLTGRPPPVVRGRPAAPPFAPPVCPRP